MKIAILQMKYPINYDETLMVMEQFKKAPYNCPDDTDLLVLPEYSNCPGMSAKNTNKIFEHCRKFNNDFLDSLRRSAAETGITVSVNMLYERTSGFTNTTILINPSGDIIAEYDKTHLAYPEISELGMIPGNHPVFTETLGAKFSFAVCFELYFPEFFERIAAEYPDIILSPSYQRSENSEILLKQAAGRALDTDAYIIRSSYSMGKNSKTGGTSYVVNPYGEIILNAGQEVGLFVVDINPKEKRMRPLAHGLKKMPARRIIEKFRIPSIYRKNPDAKQTTDISYPRVCAHRGLSGRVPENTLAAFYSALATNADELEFDVRLTKDDKMIICHDGTVDRVSEGTGKVSELTFDEMRNLNAGHYMGWNNILFPTPEEVFSSLGGTIIMNIHVYEAGHKGSVITRLKNLIDKYGIESSVYFAASEKEMAWCLELAPNISRCMLECFDESRDIVDIALEYKCERVQHFYRVYSPAVVKKAMKNNLISNLFYEDDPTLISSRLADGIDTVLTNYADLIMPIVKR